MTEKVEFPEHAWPLMRKALEHIAGHPDEFFMQEYVITREDLTDPSWLAATGIAGPHPEQVITATTGHPFPECGSVACLAGHINLLADERAPGSIYPDRAAVLALGIEDWDSPVAIRLRDVFHSIDSVRVYADLRAALERVFTFPEPLPAPDGASS